MSHQPRRVVLMRLAGVVLLVVWVAWWAVSIPEGRLRLAEHTWFRVPSLGSDFWTQSDYAARLWAGGVDPYADEHQLFHYPPLVIRLFLWTPLLAPVTALRVWIVALAALLVVGATAAVRGREALGLRPIPASLGVAVVVLSFPGTFTLERANFDLIVLAAILVALPLLRRGGRWAELAAGAVLAVGPWVKLYPGLMGLGLLALRRFRALAGFVVAGVVIGALTPDETLSSFRVLRLAIGLAGTLAEGADFPPWSHSVSLAWSKLGHGSPLLGAVPGSVVGAAFVLPLVGWVCLRAYRHRAGVELAYPLLCWICAVASAAPLIANDYSLAFLPIAAIAAVGGREPLAIRLALAASVAWWQPFALPVPGWLMLAVKLAALVAVGAVIARRAAAVSPGIATGP